jgi:hypothetical protein
VPASPAKRTVDRQSTPSIGHSLTLRNVVPTIYLYQSSNERLFSQNTNYHYHILSFYGSPFSRVITRALGAVRLGRQ